MEPFIKGGVVLCNDAVAEGEFLAFGAVVFPVSGEFAGGFEVCVDGEDSNVDVVVAAVEAERGTDGVGGEDALGLEGVFDCVNAFFVVADPEGM